MPKIIIDGQSIVAKQGQTIIEAALDHGITIPHFCWHPALSVAGNCRMCLVQVGNQKKDSEGALQFLADGQPDVAWIPKMQIACATPVADGMVVDTTGKRTVDAQEAVMEFLLVNHPLDCPICDEAGQCKLQEYAFRHSRGKSRFDDEKVHKPKRVQLGPQIMFDGERCISCSRCIRFADEVAHQPVLTFVQRGDKVTIETFPGTTFDSPYSMNVIDICPVGALTSIDFRFRARVWEMSFTDSVCPGCARGCNIKIGVMNNEVLRVEPRTNMHVNTFWMCDHGRLTTPVIVNEHRTDGPMIRANGQLQAASWDEAIAHAAEILKGTRPQDIMVLGSAHASNEDNYALAQLANRVLKTTNVDFIKHIDASFGDSQLRVAETAPNAIGAHAVGIVPATGGHGIGQLADRIASGNVKVLVVLEDSLDSVSTKLAELAAGVDSMIVISSKATVTAMQATVLLPAASFAESHGTFTNTMHRVQHFQPAVVTHDNMRSMGMAMSRWDKFGAPNDRWTNGTRRNSRSAWKIIRDIAAALGTRWTWKTSEDVFTDIAQHISGFHHMSYAALDAHHGLVLGKGNQPDPVVAVYESHVLKPN
jgi:NADH-quinone oxidoreductase subunit G